MKIIIVIFIAFLLFSCVQEDGGTDISESGTSINEKTNRSQSEAIIPVEAYIVKKGKIEEKLSLTSVSEPSQSVDIFAESSGKIIKVIKELGEVVNKGDVLAISDDVVAKSNYEQANAQVLTMQNNLKIAELNLQSDQQLFANGDISKIAYENSQLNVKAAEANYLAALANYKLMEKQYNDTRIKSPISGLVSRKHLDLGEMVNPTQPVYRVIDLNFIKFEIGISQSFISQIKIGDKAEVYISALNNKQFLGYVKFVSPEADENSGSFTAEIHVKNTSDLKIKAGMTAKVNLILKTEDEQIIVPNYALITKNDEQNVYIISKSTAKLIQVETGRSYGAESVINDGISEGDTIVVVGMKNLGIETKVWIETINNE